jgi:AcrR family transcriptional regulator
VDCPPPRRGRPPAGESPASADEILLAALKGFAAQGYDGMSVRDLNLRLGVSHNLVHRRFGSKEELWRAAVDRWFSELQATLEAALDGDGDGEAGGDPVDVLERFVVAFIEGNALRPELTRLMNVEAATPGPRLDHLFATYVRPVWRRVARLYQDLEGQGRVRPLPAGVLFFLVHGATGPASHRALADKLGLGRPADPEVAAEHARTVATALLDGLRLP